MIEVSIYKCKQNNTLTISNDLNDIILAQPLQDLDKTVDHVGSVTVVVTPPHENLEIEVIEVFRELHFKLLDEGPGQIEQEPEPEIYVAETLGNSVQAPVTQHNYRREMTTSYSTAV